jgi:hypothetical protein
MNKYRDIIFWVRTAGIPNVISKNGNYQIRTGDRRWMVSVSTVPCTFSSLPAANVDSCVLYNSRNKTCHFAFVVSVPINVTKNS